MKLKSTLVRLQNALGWDDLADRMVLSYGTQEDEAQTYDMPDAVLDQAMNVVIGYNGSPNSQMALDLALWIAYQNRLASPRTVMVHVVYVVDRRSPNRALPHGGAIPPHSPFRLMLSQAIGVPSPPPNRRHTDPPSSTSVNAKTCVAVCEAAPPPATQTLLDQADCILWQARCLAEEWRGALEAHLRFGDEQEELLRVMSEVNADLLVLGCGTPDHHLARALRDRVDCPILGIPSHLEEFSA